MTHFKIALLAFAILFTASSAWASEVELENSPTTVFSDSGGAFALLHLGGLDISGADYFKAGIALYLELGYAKEFLWLDRLNVDFGFTADFYSRPNAYIIGGTPALRWHFGSADSKVATSIHTGWWIGLPSTRTSESAEFTSGDLEHGLSAGLSMHFHLKRAWYLVIGFNKVFVSGFGSEYYLGWQTRF